jgi:hypothetical protein
VLYGPTPTPTPAAPIVKPAVPPGIELIYQVAEEKLAAQLASIDQLDTKAGVLIGALGAGIAAFVTFGHFTHPQKIVIAGLLLVSMLLATRAFVVQRYADAPDPKSLYTYGSLEPNEIKTLILPDLVGSEALNDPKLVLKGRLLNASVIIAGIAILYAFIVHVS